jgi:nicotinamide riboside transporter PnuC
MNIIEKLKASFKKYHKDWLKVAVAVVLGTLAVMHIEFADRANSAFWWNLWLVLGIVSIVGILAFWTYGWIQSWRNRNN